MQEVMCTMSLNQIKALAVLDNVRFIVHGSDTFRMPVTHHAMLFMLSTKWIDEKTITTLTEMLLRSGERFYPHVVLVMSYHDVPVDPELALKMQTNLYCLKKSTSVRNYLRTKGCVKLLNLMEDYEFTMKAIDTIANATPGYLKVALTKKNLRPKHVQDQIMSYLGMKRHEKIQWKHADVLYKMSSKQFFAFPLPLIPSSKAIYIPGRKPDHQLLKILLSRTATSHITDIFYNVVSSGDMEALKIVEKKFKLGSYDFGARVALTHGHREMALYLTNPRKRKRQKLSKTEARRT